MTREQGKPIDEAKAEVKYSASFFRWFAEESRRIRGDVLVAPERFQRQVVQKEPVGVVAAITPWNFPLAMLARKIAPAIAAGCTVLVKPSELTPLSAFALCELGIRAGLPKGVVQCITGEAQEIADEILENALVRKISFTGSVRVGKRIMAKCADNIKRISLELGGNAPFIVFQDADVRKAVDGLMASKFRNSGQTCVCANRVFVHEEIHDEFVELLAARASALRIGHGTSPGVVQGPLINEAAVEKVEGIVQDAVSRGAKILSGGQRWTGMPGFFFQPTVLTNTTMEMLCAKEEIFGPIAPVFKFSTEEEVVEKANNTNAGLAAYIFSKDLARGWRVAESLECGMVGVNTGMVSSEIAPFGGIKESGIGREGSHYGIDEYLEKKFIYLA